VNRPAPANLFLHRPERAEGETALRAAIAAGRVLQQKFYSPRQVQSKGYRDIVTDADYAANRAARRLLERAFPDYTILSEEDALPSKRAEYEWIVDPLDGTTNYARRIPIFCVSVALTRRGQPVVGVVYDVLRRECFYAERGRGAALNGSPVHVSRTAAFDQSVVGFEFSREPALRAEGLRMYRHFAMQSVTARTGGSAALSLCYIGAGRLDTYMHLTLQPWDVAAGILIAREGGARVTHLDGRPATLKGGAYLAAAPKLYAEFLEQIRALQIKL
jgi:myo-inositol-1(or 4)-monophosphatase